MPAVWTTVSTDPVEWVSSTSIQTLDGIPGCIVKVDYRVSRNYTMDIRFYITCPSAPTSFGVDVAVPPAMPSIAPGPLTTVGVYGVVLGSGGPLLHTYVARLTETVLTIFQSDDMNSIFEGSLMATVES